MYARLNVNYPLFQPDFNEIEFPRQIFEKYCNMKFHENPYSESTVVPCRRTDINDEAILRKRLKIGKKGRCALYLGKEDTS
jgi:hypothetical protein